MKLAIQKNAQILAAFAIACTAVVGITHQLTKDRIKQQEQAQLLQTLQSIVPKESHDNVMSEHCVLVNDDRLSNSEPQIVYLATQNDIPAGAAITSIAPDGYNGNIHLITAIDANGEITGVRVLKHKETPGLGDKVELRKSDWVLNFNGKDLTDINGPRWAVKKDGGMFDQFTGATITPRAVVKSVKRVALYYAENNARLFEQPNHCGDSE